MNKEFINIAYQKLKTHVYYDSSSQYLRKDVCLFERSPTIFSKKMDLLSKNILSGSLDNSYWDALYDKINYVTGVKSFKDEAWPADAIVNNRFKNNNFDVDRYIYFSEIPIELHIVSTMFVMLFGKQIEESMSHAPYGNKLDFSAQSVDGEASKGRKLYKQYHYDYKRWRTNAVNKVKKLNLSGQDSLLISLDIKDFYYSARVDFERLYGYLPVVIKENSFADNICKIFENIHEKYSKRIGIYNNIDRQYSLPIGLLSSGLLANWYLNDLDNTINNSLSCEYYGRYVDDILIVLPYSKNDPVIDKKKLIENIFLKNEILQKHGNGYRPVGLSYDNLEMQDSKFQIKYFSSDDISSAIDKYINDSKNTSSEYRLMPDQDTIDSKFDEHAHNLDYSESETGLRKIKAFSEARFGVSGYIGNKISLVMQGVKFDNGDGIKKLLKLFSGVIALEQYRLWEKAFTYFILAKEMSAFHELMRNILDSINNLESNNSNFGDKLRAFYLNNLIMASGMAYALKPSILNSQDEKNKLKELFVNHPKSKKHFFKFVDSIRMSNMVRHRYIQSPLLNYTPKKHGVHCDLIHNDSYYSKLHNKLTLSKHKLAMSPRFVNFDEVISFSVLKSIINLDDGVLVRPTENNDEKDYLNYAYNLYYKINAGDLLADDIPATGNHIYELYTTKVDNNGSIDVRDLKIDHCLSSNKLKVALVNMIIPEEVVTEQYLRSPEVSNIRWDNLRKILNHAKTSKADVLVFPEISIPVSSLFWMMNYARRNQIAMVFGLEHWIVGEYALNFIVTLLPVKIGNYKSLVASLRLKNHYSPEEVVILEDFGFLIPKNKKAYYDLITWRDIKFTVFNCYELCDINHRAIFRSKVDAIFASEFNKDVNYFSSIVDATTRDLHCYFIQSNDANFGDSRISQPASTHFKDIVKVKGGINPSVVVGEINIGDLRNFQAKTYKDQKSDKLTNLKPTPPDFDKASVVDRINS